MKKEEDKKREIPEEDSGEEKPEKSDLEKEVEKNIPEHVEQKVEVKSFSTILEPTKNIQENQKNKIKNLDELEEEKKEKSGEQEDRKYQPSIDYGQVNYDSPRSISKNRDLIVGSSPSLLEGNRNKEFEQEIFNPHLQNLQRQNTEFSSDNKDYILEARRLDRVDKKPFEREEREYSPR